jgi:hypothetical protein
MARIQNIVIGTALATVIAGCGSSGGGGGGGGGAGGDDQTANPIQSPGPAPANFDLAFRGIHYHQDYYGSTRFQPQYYSISYSVENNSDYRPGEVTWTIRRRENGKSVTGTIRVGARPAVGDGHNFAVEIGQAAAGDASWFEPGRHTLDMTLSHPQEPQGNLGNNTHTLIIDIPEGPRPQQANDLRFFEREAHVHEAQSDGRLTFHFEVENSGSQAVTNVAWRLESISGGLVIPPAPADRPRVIPSIAAGGRAEASRAITVSAPGTYVIDLIIDPDNAIGADRDSDAGNNVRRFTIVVPSNGAPSANG